MPPIRPIRDGLVDRRMRVLGEEVVEVRAEHGRVEPRVCRDLELVPVGAGDRVPAERREESDNGPGIRSQPRPASPARFQPAPRRRARSASQRAPLAPVDSMFAPSFHARASPLLRLCFQAEWRRLRATPPSGGDWTGLMSKAFTRSSSRRAQATDPRCRRDRLRAPRRGGRRRRGRGTSLGSSRPRTPLRRGCTRRSTLPRSRSKTNTASVSTVGSAGPDVIEVSGAAVSTVQL